MPNSTDSILAGIPDSLRVPLLEEFNKIQKNFRELRWEPAELNGGKFAEIVYSIIYGHVQGAFPSRPQKPKNMVDACKAMEQADSSKFCRSVRIQIPRVLMALYEIRNNRGVGHTGGDVDPNHMDASVVLSMTKWIFGELVRIFHKTSIGKAESAIEAITERDTRLIWKINETRRVLDAKMSKPNQVLLLLHSVPAAVLEDDLCEWVEHSNKSIFRRDVLKKLHKQRLLEYNQSEATAQISPKGVEIVEALLLGKK